MDRDIDKKKAALLTAVHPALDEKNWYTLFH